MKKFSLLFGITIFFFALSFSFVNAQLCLSNPYLDLTNASRCYGSPDDRLTNMLVNDCGGMYFGRPCLFTCNSGYTVGFNANKIQACIPNYSCTGSIPSGAIMCSGDDTNLTANTAWSSVANAVSCTARKCEYFMPAPPSNYSCTGIPANATVCSGDNTGLTSNTASAVVTNCSSPLGSAPKCEFTCNSGFTKSGNSCIPSTPNLFCSGSMTAPAGSYSTACPGDGAQSGTWTKVNSSSACSNLPCQYYTTAFSCTGTLPTGATMCTGDNTNLTANTSWSSVPNAASCTARKCEYYLTPNNGTCTLQNLPPSIGVSICPNDLDQIGIWKEVASPELCTSAPCEYYDMCFMASLPDGKAACPNDGGKAGNWTDVQTEDKCTNSNSCEYYTAPDLVNFQIQPNPVCQFADKNVRKPALFDISPFPYDSSVTDLVSFSLLCNDGKNTRVNTSLEVPVSALSICQFKPGFYTKAVSGTAVYNGKTYNVWHSNGLPLVMIDVYGKNIDGWGGSYIANLLVFIRDHGFILPNGEIDINGLWAYVLRMADSNHNNAIDQGEFEQALKSIGFDGDSLAVFRSVILGILHDRYVTKFEFSDALSWYDFTKGNCENYIEK